MKYILSLFVALAYTNMANALGGQEIWQKIRETYNSISHIKTIA